MAGHNAVFDQLPMHADAELEGVGRRRRFERIPCRAVDGFRDWADTRETLEAVTRDATFTHGV